MNCIHATVEKSNLIACHHIALNTQVNWLHMRSVQSQSAQSLQGAERTLFLLLVCLAVSLALSLSTQFCFLHFQSAGRTCSVFILHAPSSILSHWMLLTVSYLQALNNGLCVCIVFNQGLYFRAINFGDSFIYSRLGLTWHQTCSHIQPTSFIYSRLGLTRHQTCSHIQRTAFLAMCLASLVKMKLSPKVIAQEYRLECQKRLGNACVKCLPSVKYNITIRSCRSYGSRLLIFGSSVMSVNWTRTQRLMLCATLLQTFYPHCGSSVFVTPEKLRAVWPVKFATKTNYCSTVDFLMILMHSNIKTISPMCRAHV